MSETGLRRHRRTMRSFYVLRGYVPWMCYWCGNVVSKIGRTTWDGNVHHLDGDKTNDAGGNLEIGHTICHQHSHDITDEMKQQISDKLKGRPSPTKGMTFSAEVNAKKSRPGETNPFYGHRHDIESLTKMRRPRRRQTCVDCGDEYAMNWINRHKKEGLCIVREMCLALLVDLR